MAAAWLAVVVVVGAITFLVVDRAGPGDNLEEIVLAPADEIRVRG